MGYTVGADDYPEVIFGKDDGVQVTDTTQNVVRSVVKIYSKFVDNSGGTYLSYGTGVMISEDLVLTSGHVVWRQETNQYAQEVRVVPAEYPGNGGVVAPYGSTVAVETEVNPDYTVTKSASDDVGVIRLKDKIGQQTGYLPLSQNINIGTKVTSYGYPGDRNYMVATSFTVDGLNNNLAMYKFDTYAGQSGSPVFNENNEVVAIHSGANDKDNPTTNWGTLVTSEVTSLIKSIKDTSGAAYRVYNPNSGKHHYTSSIGERDSLVRLGWRDEGIGWYAE